MNRIFYILILFTTSFIGCSEEETFNIQPKTDWSKEQSIDMNTVFSGEEEDEIESYLKRHSDLEMTKTGSGLRYDVYNRSGNSDTVRVNDVVVVDFKINLLDGTECYSSKSKGPENFMVEKSDIESGLHEAMKQMCTDDKGIFILPSHLAHGLIGDLDKIPPLVPVIYDIHLLKIEPYENH
jgi:FKBP-type peptidyl-prolyl cis-trans isomerase